MSTIPYSTTTGLGLLAAEGVGEILSGLAKIDRVANAALAAAYALGGGSPDFSALTAGDFGLTDGATDGPDWFTALDSIRLSLTGGSVAQGAAKDGLTKLDKGA